MTGARATAFGGLYRYAGLCSLARQCPTPTGTLTLLAFGVGSPCTTFTGLAPPRRCLTPTPSVLRGATAPTSPSRLSSRSSPG
eukprot:scaffold13583_cov27-Tisochrysis_lutea.AAC.3